LQVQLKAIEVPARWRNWISGDVHVHMNYGGAYVTTPERLVAQAAAEDLDVVFNLVVNKEQRIPDIGYFSTAPDSASDASTLLLHAQEFHTSFWGHLGLLGLQQNLLLPDYSAYAGTAAASLYPDNAVTAKLARDQGAAVGYVHPFLSPAPDPESEEKLSNALPVDAALGLVDYYEVVGFADHRASAEVWYRLLNCGLRVAAAGGTDAMANYASLRGPVGINRTYVQLIGKAASAEARRDRWLDGLKAGRSMASNGPLLGLELGEQGPGSEIKIEKEGQALEYRGFMRSIVPMDHLELVQNGEVIKTIQLSGDRRSADVSGTLNAERNGWVLLRAWNDNSSPLVFDIYPYATTSPVYLNVNGRRARSKDDADYFLAWLTRIREALDEHEDFNNDAERNAILEHISSAEQVYKACR
jgi:hypothetical protein